MRTDGCVVVPPHLTVCFATKEPNFIPNGSLLMNLRFGCGSTVPESVVWVVCEQLGLRHTISRHIGHVPMMHVLAKATTSQIQMLSLARAILCEPDVLLVDDFEVCQGVSTQTPLAPVARSQVRGFDARVRSSTCYTRRSCSHTRCSNPGLAGRC